jgi:predicted aspartyl protease
LDCSRNARSQEGVSQAEGPQESALDAAIWRRFDDVVEFGPPGREQIRTLGPSLLVQIGLDMTYDPGAVPLRPPTLPQPSLWALVDTGASECCIDSGLAMQLNLPIIDQRPISGVHGSGRVNVHLAQIHAPSLGFTIYGAFCGVNLVAGGQAHYALIGRTFLRYFTMVYDGRTGTVTLSND